MGGRGASSGFNKHGKPLPAYGTEFETLLEHGTIKFVRDVTGQGKSPQETRTIGRIYAVVSKTRDSIKNIELFDRSGRLERQISLDHSHGGMKPIPMWAIIMIMLAP